MKTTKRKPKDKRNQDHNNGDIVANEMFAKAQVDTVQDTISRAVFSSIERGEGFCNPIRNKIEWEEEE